MSRGQVLLLSCYELGRQPSGLVWPGAFLSRAGIATDAADLAVDPFPEPAARRARLVAISVPMHTALRLGLEAAERVRGLNPRAHVCFHGLYAGLNAELLLAGPADSVISGEVEEALVGLAACVLRGDPEPAVPGVATAGRPAQPVRRRLDFPPPRRDGLAPPARYAQLVDAGRRVPVAFVESTRGCLHTCRHCPVVPIYAGRFFALPAETVLADVRRQVAAGARHVSFGDPDFLNGPTHAMRIARALPAELPGISFDFTAKVEHLLRHAALLPELAGLGCRFVTTAVESLSDRVLGRLHKGHVGSDADRALDLLDAAGIALQPTFVPFTPWSGLDDYIELVEWVGRHGLVRHVPPVQLSVRLLIPPGSALLENGGEADWLGPLDSGALGHRWTHPDPRMDALHATVSGIAETASARREPATVTFGAIRDAAFAAADREPSRRPSSPLRPEPPRLSEDWFCCSEPTRAQVAAVGGLPT